MNKSDKKLLKEVIQELDSTLSVNYEEDNYDAGIRYGLQYIEDIIDKFSEDESLLVYLESPYAGNMALNIRYACECMADCFRRKEFPFASHLLYTQDGILDDNNPVERELGMSAGFAWGRHANKTVVYTDLGISPGMAKGIEVAEKCGRPVEYRKLFKTYKKL